MLQLAARIVLKGKIPSTNRYWRFSKKSGVRVSSDAKKFKDYVYLSYLSQNKNRKKIAREHGVAIKIYWFCNKKCNGGDLDNKIKILLDALESVVYENDNQICSIEAHKFTNMGKNVMVVDIYEEISQKSARLPKNIETILESLNI